MNESVQNPAIDLAIKTFSESEQFELLSDRSKIADSITGLTAPACGWVLARLATHEARPVVVVLPTEADALAAVAGAHLAIAEDDPTQIVHYAAPALTPFQETDPALRILAGHARALDAIADRRPTLVVVDASALTRPLPPPERWAAQRLEVRVGEEIQRRHLLDALTTGGYERAERVGQVGEFAVRGAVVDVFSPAEDRPVRLEFFGDEVVTMRGFDPQDQRTLPMTPVVLSILPVLSFPILPDTTRCLAATLRDRVSPLAQEEADRRLGTLSAGGLPAGWSDWVVLLEESPATLLQWIAGEDLAIWDPPAVGQALEESWELLEADAAARAHQIGFELSPDELAVPPARSLTWLEQARIQIAVWVEAPVSAGGASRGEIDFGAVETESVISNPDRLPLLLARQRDRGLSPWLAYTGDGAVARGFLEQIGPDVDMELVAGDLPVGFELPAAGFAVFAERQLYAPPRIRRRRPPAARSQRAAFLGGLQDLKVGDYVVHEEHGIGRYAGIRRIAGEERDRDGLPEWAQERGKGDVADAEVLEVVYRNGRTLLLPIDRVGLLSRFSGVEGVEPRLDSLGGTSWQSRRERVRAGVKKLAVDLLELYASRQTARAVDMAPDGPLLRKFEEAFPYQETPDQQRAIDDVQQDLARAQPMDRLLCGDVGFGKTEVAMRAAAQAVEAGTQVAVLAPTTILADQHLTSFRRRFRGLPVNIEMLSRFRSDAEVRNLFERLEAGEIDILVGTHRLLGEVPFRRLGLLVIDEEQRFGVSQKEQLVDARKNVHVLSMSATPVPRTLQLALGGVRDLSLIETPPRDRMAVETAVVPFSQELVREACERERGRGGQIYYLYNRVESIEDIQARLREWLPDFRITVGHGRLPEQELARRMHAFADGEYDLLLATTIIANGIDIPNVNTMLIHDAQRFGLGELYQLRGRVGRSDRLGFCYLMVSQDRVVSDVARKRLAAIREFTELGAGFRVAARDLEIRGAGDVLGAEQSGHIASVGVDTYLKMLDQAVRRLRGEEIVEEVSCELELPGGAGIPEHYVQEPGLRLELYQRLADDAVPLEETRLEIRDRFGALPEEVEELIAQHRLRRRAERVRVQSISYQSGSLHLRFRSDAEIDVERLVEWMEQEPAVDFSPSGVLTVTSVAPADAVTVAGEVLAQLSLQSP